jgi:hypothetical protein
MINPLKRVQLKGFLFYQGEANAGFNRKKDSFLTLLHLLEVNSGLHDVIDLMGAKEMKENYIFNPRLVILSSMEKKTEASLRNVANPSALSGCNFFSFNLFR